MLTDKLSVLSFLILSFWLNSDSSLAAGPSAQLENGWELIQAHVGQKLLRVQITGKGIRIDAVRSTWSIISEAPKWDAVIFSRADKTICRLPYAYWSRFGFSIAEQADEMSVAPKARLIQKGIVQIGSYKNLPVTIERWKGPAQTLASAMFQSKEKAMADFMYVGCTQVNAPPQARQLLKQFYETPPSDGIPLRLSSSSEPRPMLDTIDIKSCALSPAIFAAPSGYRSVKTDQEVWLNDQDKQKINDLGELIGPADKRIEDKHK